MMPVVTDNCFLLQEENHEIKLGFPFFSCLDSCFVLIILSYPYI